MSKSDKLQYVAIIVFLPFVISSGIHFLPTWISMPLTLVCGMFWLGTIFLVKDIDNE